MATTNPRVVLAFARASRALNVERRVQRLEAEWQRLRAREQEILRELQDLQATRDTTALAVQPTHRRA